MDELLGLERELADDELLGLDLDDPDLLSPVQPIDSKSIVNDFFRCVLPVQSSPLSSKRA